MKKAVRLKLTGTIQGIFFKGFMKEHAARFGVTGYVRKIDEGRLEIYIEGNTDKVDAMAEICRKGPPHANFRNVEEKEERFQGAFSDFRVFSF